ncbi:FEKKY domain-containing protein [Polaribacter sp. SA4-12]|uniref:FEKKY domain-containing protein n=1 Tax=Polaribacter sp. SA4-12 TaxID=1312072 RepID=UPI0012FAC69C|nr:hypothetical protein [Polaribacter sp. SA4-12]
MKLKTSIIFSILSFLGIYLLFSNSDVRNINKFNLLLNISAILILIGIIGFIIYLIAKESRKIKNITIGLVFISLVINSYVGFYKYQMNKRNKILSEYYELKTCKEMETRFASDLKKGEIKYFFFGIGYDTELAKILDDKYKIETFGMGCMIQSKMICYNELVDKFLKEKYSNSINEIYKEIRIE